MSEAWQPRTVGKSVRITKGVTYASSDYASKDGGHVFLTIKCFAKGGGFNTEGVKYFRGVYLAEQEIAPGELLIAKTDLTRDGDIIGSPMIAPDFGEGKKVLPSMDLSVLRAMDGDTDLRFLFYRLMLGDARRFMWAHSAGSTVLHLESKALPKFTFSAPKRAEQRRIAEILLTLDEAIEQTEALIAKHQQIKAGLMHDLFTRGVSPDGHLRHTREQAPDHYKESPLGWIPREWEVKPLAAFTQHDITYGIVQAGPHIENGVPYIRTGDMAGDSLIWSEMLRTSRAIADSYKRSEVRIGEIVCAIRATVGKVLRVPPDLDGANLTQGTARIAPNLKTDAAFLLWAIRAERTQRTIMALIKGTTFSEITLGDLRKLPIAAPSKIGEQRLISQRLDQCDKMIASESKYLDKLRQQKNGLMHDILTGRVRVNINELGDVQ